ncbi:transporter substrate-binding domain-containing protein [Isoptericola sp. b441]|uniref:Transporter substrate-binding domain-containing protein n=1 Tax=Actinotalea lenta TaxID=3064654 RepID=A0ABT9D8Q7_9CELL|nr:MULTISPECIES: transporter substrate-binding domain-containing protein [unclassified Isoptericola]MDO8107282.1 transporter substrate-binding domain-containing protein [Isoptericola sp. b441]MDO8121056.1 transporter substrate-binding domain-containing protein [Isoptericola sp. b490]
MARLRIAALGAISVLTLAACSSTAGSSSSDGASEVPLVTPGTLTVCTNPPYEPFEYQEGDKLVGLDIDVVQQVADDLGVTLTTVETGFDGIQSGAALNAGTCDLVASAITITDERKGKLDFSDPYFDANQGLLVPTGSGLDSLESLAGKKVGVQQATTGADFAKKNNLDTLEYEDLGLQIQGLKNGDVDAVINDIAVLGPYATDGYEVGTEFVTGEQYGLGVKKGNTALLDKVNATLTRIKSDGTYDSIYTTYIGTAPSKG